MLKIIIYKVKISKLTNQYSNNTNSLSPVENLYNQSHLMNIIKALGVIMNYILIIKLIISQSCRLYPGHNTKVFC